MSIDARLPEAWRGLLNQEIALVGVMTDCLAREVGQAPVGSHITDGETPRVIDLAPTQASEEVVQTAQGRLFEECRG